eukprot:2417770-Amphidinium_carterae.1
MCIRDSFRPDTTRSGYWVCEEALVPGVGDQLLEGGCPANTSSSESEAEASDVSDGVTVRVAKVVCLAGRALAKHQGLQAYRHKQRGRVHLAHSQ